MGLGLHKYTLKIADDPTGQHQGETYVFTQSYGGASNNPLKYWDWDLVSMGAAIALKDLPCA